MKRLPVVCVSACIVAMLIPALGRADDAGVPIAKIPAVYVPAEPNNAERNAAQILAAELSKLYSHEVKVVRGRPEDGAAGVIVGRRLAGELGLVTAAELEAVKPDGYVLKAAGNRIAVAGWDQAGTLYGAYGLLRRLGVHTYPWRGGTGNVAQVRPAKPPQTVAPFSAAEAPFFLHRDVISHIAAAPQGITMRPYRLADPKSGADQKYFGRDRKDYTKYTFNRSDWVDWCHTAPYLMPRDRYLEEHPEYFAIHDGKPIGPRPYCRMQICFTHPDVIAITQRRLLEWIEAQKDMRVFCIVPADTKLCECERCRAQDPIPDYRADRVMKWVNTLATTAGAKYPDKTFFTGAYADYVKPPLKVMPADNVVPLYAPWFWNSRATSSVSLDSPLNVIAMKELMGWCIAAPGHVGLYDYPGGKGFAAARRTKMYARHGVRHIYYNGARGDRMQWLAGQICWDPFQDIESVWQEFADATYGPAAEPMKAYFQLRRDAVREHCVHSRAVFLDSSTNAASVPPRFYTKVRPLLGAAREKAESADDATRLRVCNDVAGALAVLLRATHPHTGSPHLRSDPKAYGTDFRAYVDTAKTTVSLAEKLKLKYMTGTLRSDILATLGRVGVKSASPPKGAGREALAKHFDQVLAAPDKLLAESLASEAPPAPKDREVRQSFAADGEAAQWLSDATDAELVRPAKAGEVTAPSGTTLRGVRIEAPLSKLPVVPRGNIRIHVGRFFAERTFAEPLDIAGCRYLDVHLHASADVPVTLYFDHYRADFDLHAGEQIVRLDLGNVGRRGGGGAHPKTLTSLAVDIWPQDNYYPYPTARDADVTLLSLTATTRKPTGSRLPYRKSAVWLSQFRPNVPNGVKVPAEHQDKLKRTKQTHRLFAYEARREHEGFRTFTEHRAVSPIRAILTGGGRADRQAARAVQHCLAKLFNVTLPIDPPGLRPGPNVGNVILVGKHACLAAGQVTRKELDYAGAGGGVVNAWQGRIALAGPDDAGTATAVRRYLEDHHLRILSRGAVKTQSPRRGMLHELYTIERRWFEDGLKGDDWLAYAAGRPAARPLRAPTPADVRAARDLAERIRDLARAGKHRAGADVLRAAEQSDLARYVAGRLLHNPTDEVGERIAEFQALAGRIPAGWEGPMPVPPVRLLPRQVPVLPRIRR